MRNGILLASLGFAITLAIIVGNRLSNEAMAVLVGALCGVSATLPISLAFFIAMSRNWGHEPSVSPEPRAYSPQPPVFVIAPQPQTAAPNFYGSPYAFPPPANALGESRQFKIIGED